MTAVETASETLGTAAACDALGVSRAAVYRRRQPARVAGPAADAAAGARSGRTATRARDARQRAVSRSGAGPGPCDAARRRHLPVLAAHDVPPVGRRRRGQGAARSGPAPALRRAGTAGHAAQRSLELGHHQAARPGQVDLLLSVRDPRHLQPVRRRLDDRAPRERGARRAAHRRDVREARHRARPTDAPCRPGRRDAQQARRAAAGRSRGRQDPQPAVRVQRQPVFRSAVPNAEVPSRNFPTASDRSKTAGRSARCSFPGTTRSIITVGSASSRRPWSTSAKPTPCARIATACSPPPMPRIRSAS